MCGVKNGERERKSAHVNFELDKILNNDLFPFRICRLLRTYNDGKYFIANEFDIETTTTTRQKKTHTHTKHKAMLLKYDGSHSDTISK